MNLHPNGLLHIYNRGNNRQTIFFTNRNYLYFLAIREYAGFRNSKLVNKRLAATLLDLPTEADSFYREPCKPLPDEHVKCIFA